MIENKDGDGIKLPSPADVYLKEINETKKHCLSAINAVVMRITEILV
jgi:hypothetical protein